MKTPTRRWLTTALAVLAVVLVGTADAGPARSDDSFVSGIEDLPLMPGLVNAPEASVTFEALAGRIVVAFAEGSVSMPEVRAFYGATLPQLGWERTAPGRWTRAGEELSLDAVVEGDGLVVRFEVTPR